MMFKRVLMGVGANAVGQAVSIGLQLVSLPLFLHFWNNETYGKWLLLAAVPGYLAMTDFGIVGAVGNKMTMAIGRGDAAQANVSFQSGQVFLLSVCCTLAALTGLVLWLAPLPAYLDDDMKWAIACLALSILLNVYGGISDAAFKATQRYALGILVGQVLRISEFLGWAIGLWAFGSFSGVAACGLLGNALGNLTRLVVSLRNTHGLRFGVALAERRELVEAARPALSFSIYGLSNALAFQAITLLVGAVAGPAAVAVFNTHRTVARLTVQASAMLSHALWPEMSHLYGAGGLAAVYPLFRRSALISAAQALALSTVVYLLAPWLMRVWTHGGIVFHAGLMAVLLTYATVAGLWHVPKIVLMATNRHHGISLGSLFAAGLSVLLGWWLAKVWDINGVAAAMLIGESTVAIYCAWIVLNAFAPYYRQGAAAAPDDAHASS